MLSFLLRAPRTQVNPQTTLNNPCSAACSVSKGGPKGPPVASPVPLKATMARRPDDTRGGRILASSLVLCVKKARYTYVHIYANTYLFKFAARTYVDGWMDGWMTHTHAYFFLFMFNHIPKVGPKPHAFWTGQLPPKPIKLSQNIRHPRRFGLRMLYRHCNGSRRG